MKLYVVMYDGDLIGVYSSEDEVEICKKELVYASGAGCWYDIEDEFVIRIVWLEDKRSPCEV